MTWEEFEQ